MDPNVISMAARALRTRLAEQIGIAEGNIFIGHPASSVERAEGQAGKQYLNLFVYEVEHAGYPADGLASDPTFVRLRVLITPLGNDDSGAAANRATAGENDLRLIGAVVAALHELPILTLENPEEDARAQLQIVPIPFTIENVNNLWATQLNVSYRPSVAYELALAPVPFARKRERSPLVGRASADAQALPSAASSETFLAGRAACEIRFVDSDGALQVALTLPRIPPTLSVRVALAGPVGESVVLRWETWSAASGWSTAPSAPPEMLQSAALDPAHAVELALPEVPDVAPRQYLLAATGVFHDAQGSSFEARSNRLLISVFEEPA